MAGLEAADSTNPAHLADVRRAFMHTLGEELASELCDGAGGTAEIAARFTRLRARLLLTGTVELHPKAR